MLALVELSISVAIKGKQADGLAILKLALAVGLICNDPLAVSLQPTVLVTINEVLNVRGKLLLFGTKYR